MTELVLLALAALMQAVVIGVLAVCIAYQARGSRRERDFLLWQLRKLRNDHDTLDATVEQILEGLGSQRR